MKTVNLESYLFKLLGDVHFKKCTALSHILTFKESPLKLTFEQHGGLGTGPPYPGKSAYELVICPLYWWPQSITRGVVPWYIFIGGKKMSDIQRPKVLSIASQK